MTKHLLIALLLATSTFLSCGDSIQKKESISVKKETEQKEEKPDPGKFKLGKWQLDSVAENFKIAKQFEKKDTLQVLNFATDGDIHAIEINPRFESSRPIGKWKVVNDSIFYLDSHNQIYMRFGFVQTEESLTLHGNFFISESIKKKPTFYCSRFHEHFD